MRFNKLTILFFGLFISLRAFGQETSDLKFKQEQDSISKLWRDTSLYFPQVKFVKVVGYTFNEGLNQESAEDFTIYDAKKKKFAKAINPVHFVLTKSQINALLNIINDTTTFEGGESGCYIPHHAFVFYDTKENPVAYINICFMCHQTEAMPTTPIMLRGVISEKGWARFHDFCKLVGLPVTEE